MSEVEQVKGSFGNFTVSIRQRPRYVQADTCIGCAECIPPCPVSYPSAAQEGLGPRKAMDYVFFGGLPNAPYLDPAACTRFTRGDACQACLDACTIPGAIDFQDRGRVVERTVGSVVLAVGGDLYDAAALPNLGHGRVPGVITSMAMERLLSSNGPFGGVPQLADGSAPRSVGIVHCVGSLDERHRDYCSGVCCMGAFKLNQLVTHKLPGVPVTHYYKTLSMAGKEDAALYRKAIAQPGTSTVAFASIDDLAVEAGPDGRPLVRHAGVARTHDLLVLMPAMVPGKSVGPLGALFDAGTDRSGYLEELHDRVDVSRSKQRGVYLAGTCHAPMDLGRAMTEGVAAAGAALSALVPGRQLELEATHATVDPSTCVACYTCVPVCPYHAVSGAGGLKAEVAAALCTGCGTCVAACPTGAMHGLHFDDQQILAEIEGVLQ
jgi:heterodisulfide reductase subunit A